MDNEQLEVLKARLQAVVNAYKKLTAAKKEDFNKNSSAKSPLSSGKLLAANTNKLDIEKLDSLPSPAELSERFGQSFLDKYVPVLNGISIYGDATIEIDKDVEKAIEGMFGLLAPIDPMDNLEDKDKELILQYSKIRVRFVSLSAELKSSEKTETYIPEAFRYEDGENGTVCNPGFELDAPYTMDVLGKNNEIIGRFEIFLHFQVTVHN